MIEELKQKRGLNYRKHTLYENKIVVEYRNLKDIIKYEVKIDQIGFDIQYEKENTLPGRILFYFFLSFPFIFLTVYLFDATKVNGRELIGFSFLAIALAIIGLLKQNKDDIFLIGGQKNLVFYRNIPDEPFVLKFIEKIKITSKQYLKLKYTEINDIITEEEFSIRLNWLLGNEIITHSEFTELKEDFKIQRLL